MFKVKVDNKTFRVLNYMFVRLIFSTLTIENTPRTNAVEECLSICENLEGRLSQLA